MTGVKISALPAANAANDGDQIEVNQAGVSRRVTVGQIAIAASRSVFVEDFGAVGDGVTDDTVAIQLAFDTAALDGSTVQFQARTYRITSTVTMLNSPSAVRGQTEGVSGKGTTILVDTIGNTDETGVRFINCDHGSLESMTVTGPATSGRFSGGFLAQTTHSTGFFTVRDVFFSRGYNGLGLTGGLVVYLEGIRTNTIYGTAALFCSPEPDDPTPEVSVAVQAINCSFGASGTYERYNGDGVTTIYSAPILVPDLALAEIWIKNRDTLANRLLTTPGDYTITQTSGGMRVVLAVAPTVREYVEFKRRQPRFEGDAFFDASEYGTYYPICMLFDSSASIKLNQCASNFGGDAWVFRNARGLGGGAFYYLSNGGTENQSGDGIRIETGTDFKLNNLYFGGLAGHGVHIKHNPIGEQNISDVQLYETAIVKNSIRIITSAAHGLVNEADGYIKLDVIVSSVSSNPRIEKVNGRWRASVLSPTEIWIDSHPTSEDADATWKEPGGAEPVYIQSTGNWRVGKGLEGGAVISNLRTRTGGAGIMLDSPWCSIDQALCGRAGSANRLFWGFDIASLSANSNGKLRVTLKYPWKITACETCRVSGVLKAGVPIHNLPTDVSRIEQISNLVFDLTDITAAGPYDPPTALLTAFLLRANPALMMGPNAHEAIISESNFGKFSSQEGLHYYSIINQCAAGFTVHDCNLLGAKVAPILNLAPHQEQRWSDNIVRDGGVGARAGYTYNDGINTNAQLFGSSPLIKAVTVPSAVPSVFTSTAHHFAVGQEILLGTTGDFGGLGPIPADYFVHTVLDPNTFLASATLGGNPVVSYGTVHGLHTVGHRSTVTLANPAVWTNVAHGYSAGEQVELQTSGALPAPFAVQTPYFVLGAGLTADTFRLALTAGGPAISTLASSQSGTHIVGKPLVVALAAAGVLTSTAHGLIPHQVVTFQTTGVLPAPLLADTPYNVIAVPTVDTFTIHTSPDALVGMAIYGTTQSGTHTMGTIYGEIGWQFIDSTTGQRYTKTTGGASTFGWTADAVNTGVTNTFTVPQVIDTSHDTLAALRVTQRGTGNALLIEDATNPDTTPFVINNAGLVITGHTDALTQFGTTPRVQIHGTLLASTTFGLGHWGSSASAPATIAFAKSQSGTIGTHAAVTVNSDLGQIRFEGSDGTAFFSASDIIGEADLAATTGIVPGRLRFSTANSAGVLTSRARFDSKGLFNVGEGGSLGRGPATAKTADFTVNDSDNWLVNNKAGATLTITLPAASTCTGRELMISNWQAQAVLSASANVVPLPGPNTPGTAILSANAGRWCTLVAGSTNWTITQGVV
jgi:hypothetical protein